MPVDAVLFDLDNTLYPYPPCNEAGKRRALAAARERGYDLDHDSFADLYREGRRETKRDTATTAAAHHRLLYFRHGLKRRYGDAPPADALALADAFWSGYLQAMEPFDDLGPTLEALADDGVAVGVTTNLTTRIQYRKLRRLGIADRLECVVTSEETGREKPGSVMFTLPLARLDRRPSEAVLVGDQPVTDVAGGNAVGLTTVLFNGEVPADAPDAHRPDHEIDTLGELPEVLERC